MFPTLKTNYGEKFEDRVLLLSAVNVRYLQYVQVAVLRTQPHHYGPHSKKLWIRPHRYSLRYFLVKRDYFCILDPWRGKLISKKTHFFYVLTLNKVIQINLITTLSNSCSPTTKQQHRILPKYVRNNSNLSLQLKYSLNIFFKYCKISHHDFNFLKYFWKKKKIFNSFRNIVERFRWIFLILHILQIFQNVASATRKKVTVIFK